MTILLKPTVIKGTTFSHQLGTNSGPNIQWQGVPDIYIRHFKIKMVLPNYSYPTLKVRSPRYYHLIIHFYQLIKI